MAGLYLHIPFCLRKCSYCDFYSFVDNRGDLSTYPDLLVQHMRWISKEGWQQPIETIYFGGGTPSLLSPSTVAGIIEKAHRLFDIADNAEVTLEINPGTVSQKSLDGYRSAGVNRLSVGLQTTSERQLALLGRLHSRKDGVDCINWARRAGFTNISLDLMFALPGQTLTELEEELQSYIALAPEHISCYGLTAEPGTPLHEEVNKGNLVLPDEDLYADAFLQIHERLSDAGYDHYEIANYASNGLVCRHNMAYWQRQPYLGIGAGAHSFYTENRGSRWQTPDDLDAYRAALEQHIRPDIQLETFDYHTALKETVYLALRTRDGVKDNELQANFGCRFEEAFPEAVRRSSKWLREDSGHWSLTVEGWLIFNSLILHFL